MDHTVKSLLLSLLLTLSLLASSCNTAGILKQEQHAASHQIIMENELVERNCSATAIAPHVLLTAAHCYLPLAQSVRVDGSAISFKLEKRILDGKDHMLLVLPEANFTSFVEYYPASYREPWQGEHVYMWGNPIMDGHLYKDQYREGYVSGTDDEPFGNEKANVIWYLLVFPGAGGDSGSAVYDEDGRLVTVVTYGFGDGNFMGGYPLAFTTEQVIDAEK
jgi:hypothetical protein